MSNRKRTRRVAVLLCGAAAAVTSAVRADTFSISIGVRETGSAGAIGSDGGTTGKLEWINLDGLTLNANSTWQDLTWNFGTDPVTAFDAAGTASDGNGILNGTKGVLESIRIRNNAGNALGGNIQLRIDDIVNTVAGVPTTITGFEGYSTATASNTIMFHDPVLSTETRQFNTTGQNSTLISTVANSGTQSLAARWAFVPDGSTTQWLHLYTGNTTTLPNPVIDFSPGSKLKISMRGTVVAPTGTRAVGIDVSSNQGTGINWATVAAPMASGGGGRQFAQIRASRGGTSGTSTTGAMRVDDTTYAYNIAGAKAAGILTGPYHFARPDIWTAASAGSLVDSPTTPITPEDEARHFMEVAGTVMKPGYMRPMYDLEDGDVETTNAQMTNYVKRFMDHLIKYKGTAAKVIIYAGGNYTSQINAGSGLEDQPLWYPNYNIDGDWSAGDPSSGNYGIWGNGTPKPWSFWQYYSPDAYVPGVPGGSSTNLTHNDLDVAHGDINFVKQYMVQGAIWDGSTDATWTQVSNWDTNAQPGSTTEVLFDTTIPGTGSTITLSAFRTASGVYFANNYTLSGGGLTLSDGRIDVDVSKTATLATALSTPNGFRKVGTGTLTQSSGSMTVTGIAQVLQGNLNITGGTVSATGNLLVDSELTQYDKGVIAPVPTLASQITSSSMTVNGGAVSAAAVYVGGTDTASGAIATLNVSSGSLTTAGVLKIWNSAVNLVDSKVNLSGGTISAGSLDTNTDIASFNWTAGTLAITGAGGFNVSASGPLGSSLTVGPGKTLNVTNTLTVGASSTVSLSNVMSVGNIDVGGDQTRFNWTGGTLTHTGPGASDLGTRSLGSGGGSQILNLTGGTLTNASLSLASATVNHSGGTHNITTLNIGTGLSTAGVHAVSGSANLAVSGNIYLGGTSGAGSTPGGIMNVSGGTVTTPALKIWNSGPASPAGTRLNLTGGTVNAGSIDVNGNIARLNLNGGTLNHTGGSSNLGGLNVVAGALSITGGTVTGTTITNNAAGNLAVNNGGTLSAPVTNNGTMTMNGGTVTSAVNNVGTMNVTGANPSTFGVAATVDNPGSINVQSPANVAFNAGLAGTGSVTVASGATATTLALAVGNTLTVGGSLTVNANAPTGFVIANNLAVTGTLDVKNNDLVVLNTPLGAWNGTAYTGVLGMVSTGKIVASSATPSLTALAVAEAGAVGRTQIDGFPVDPDDVIGFFTYVGDTNLDGLVDADDYFQLDSHYNKTGNASKLFSNGDLNYDGKFNGDDYFLMDASFASQGAPFSGAAGIDGVSIVPEPGGAMLLAAGLVALRKRRARR